MHNLRKILTSGCGAGLLWALSAFLFFASQADADPQGADAAQGRAEKAAGSETATAPTAGLARLLKSTDDPDELKRRLQSLSRLGASLRKLKEQKKVQNTEQEIRP